MTKSQLKELIKEVLSEQPLSTTVDKKSLHSELVSNLQRIKYIRSFLNYGQNISGSGLKDLEEINTLKNRCNEILKLLKK